MISKAKSFSKSVFKGIHEETHQGHEEISSPIILASKWVFNLRRSSVSYFTTQEMLLLQAIKIIMIPILGGASLLSLFQNPQALLHDAFL